LKDSDQPKKFDFIPYGRQWVTDSDVETVSKVLQSAFLTTGPEAAKFEAALCELTGAQYAVVCANGTAALHLACLALGIKEGDLGVTSPNTFLASANCLEFCGGEVDFVDIDPDSLCLSPKKLEEYCVANGAPKVVIPVDFSGVPADLPAIHALAQKYGFAVIEDAAHSIGTSYTHEGQVFMCGSCAHSDLAIFSFHPVKTITSGEGGAVLTNNKELADRVRMFSSHGMVRCQDLESQSDGPWYYEMTEMGYNYRITDFQCALGNAQLKHLDHFKKRRLEIVERYNIAFKDCDELITPIYAAGSSVSPHLYPIQFRGGSSKRFEVYHSLRDDKIYCQIHYIPVYWQPYYKNKYGFEKGMCPVSEEYYNRCLSLPLFPAMTDEEVDYVIHQVLSKVQESGA
jgi:perosamine synthetase